jgi:sirohydrochlorin ferrochelatase
MTAPALVTLAVGPADPRAVTTVREIVATTRRLRPDLRISAAFCADARLGLKETVESLAAGGVEEVVVVPLLVSPDEQDEIEVQAAVTRATLAQPATRFRVSEPLGADPSLLSVLAERMRSALRSARARDLDATVLAATGARDPVDTAAITRLARVWSSYHHVPTSVAFVSATPPSTGEAVREWRRRGKRNVAVGSLSVIPGGLADRAAELALEAGASAVSSPLGAHDALSCLIVARYSVAALELVPI